MSLHTSPQHCQQFLHLYLQWLTLQFPHPQFPTYVGFQTIFVLVCSDCSIYYYYSWQSHFLETRIYRQWHIEGLGRSLPALPWGHMSIYRNDSLQTTPCWCPICWVGAVLPRYMSIHPLLHALTVCLMPFVLSLLLLIHVAMRSTGSLFIHVEVCDNWYTYVTRRGASFVRGARIYW